MDFPKEIEIDINTEQIDETINKAQELADILDELSPRQIIRGNFKNCVFNFAENINIKI